MCAAEGKPTLDEFIRNHYATPSPEFVTKLRAEFPTASAAVIHAALMRVANETQAEAEELQRFKRDRVVVPIGTR
jgi:hypothetical protein